MMLDAYCRNLKPDELNQFLMIYREKRKDPQTILLLTLVGFIGIAGLHRFYTEDVVWGIIFLLTGGFCGIGTIVDLVKHKEIAHGYNHKMAMDTMAIFNMLSQNNNPTSYNVKQ
jgi:TM2 domain-containing membrane protein YozV